MSCLFTTRIAPILVVKVRHACDAVDMVFNPVPLVSPRQVCLIRDGQVSSGRLDIVCGSFLAVLNVAVAVSMCQTSNLIENSLENGLEWYSSSSLS